MKRIKTLISNRVSIFLIFTIFLCIPAYSYAADFNLVLQWNANTDPDLADNPRYKIYYKTGSSAGNDKNAYIGLPATEPDVADEGVSP